MKLITTTYHNNQKKTTTVEEELRPGQGGMQCVNVYPEVEYQTILGFGGAITEAAGYAFSKLGKENKEKVLDFYFGKEGNNYNMVRSHIDSCDFSLDVYSAMTDAEDTKMKSLSLDRDDQYIIPLMKQAQERRGKAIDIMLSPWSPPPFMKTNGEKLHGGKLKPEYRIFWAEYICRYCMEYEKRGLTVNRLTIQNEPAAVQSWDSCIYTAEEEKEFLRDFLHPALVTNGLSDIKINIWDHNKERMYQRAKAIIDKDTDMIVDGVAFHWYSGDHFESIQVTHEAFPTKELIFTEGCVEYSRFDTNQLRNAQMYAHDILGNLNSGMTGSIDWNIILNEKGGPNHVNNNCDAPIMVDTENDTFEVKLSFDYIGHFSRYIQKGAKRIAFSKYTDQLEMTAFKNKDNSLVLVMLNSKDSDIPVTVDVGDKIFQTVIKGNTIVTAVI
ncbi:MAG: glycoside hydrolase family 30 protein [Mobilitalea sp.]